MSIFLDLLIIIGTILLGTFVSLILYARWHYGTLEGMGYPVVKPHWLLGSNYNYMELNHHWEDLRRTEKLGPVFGVYNGRTPEIYVADPEMIQQMMFKDPAHFLDKSVHNFGMPTLDEIMEFTNGDKWKIERSMLSPMFTAAKMRVLTAPLQRLCDEYISILNENVKHGGGRYKAEIYRFLPPFSIEVIAECMCGMKIQDARSPTNEFVNLMRLCMMEDITFDWTYNFLQVFPFMTKFLSGMPIDGLNFFDQAIKGILDTREASGVVIPDTVQTLLEMRRMIGSKRVENLDWNLHTVYGQAYNFFVPAFFGINTTIAHLFYHLAMNPQVQDQLRDEVDKVLTTSEGKIDMDVLSTSFPYLTSCLFETLRISTSFHRLDRTCTKDWEYNGWKIKKGTHVIIPMYPIHQNPKYHPEPRKFNPDRFMPENKDKLENCSVLAFGLGNRKCIGTKFVMEAMKSLMLRVVRDFTIEKRGDTIWKEHNGNHFLLQLDPLYVDLVERN